MGSSWLAGEDPEAYTEKEKPAKGGKTGSGRKRVVSRMPPGKEAGYIIAALLSGNVL